MIERKTCFPLIFFQNAFYNQNKTEKKEAKMLAWLIFWLTGGVCNPIWLLNFLQDLFLNPLRYMAANDLCWAFCGPFGPQFI
jgi:hypothetical protein